jgi:hypothetical protein
MARSSRTVALAALFLLTGVSVIVAAQERPNRVSDQQVRDLSSRIETGVSAFRASFDQAINRNPINGSRAEDDINRSVNDFKQATDRWRDRLQNRRAGASDVEEVLRRASVIDGFMTGNALDAAAERDWQSLRGELDALARAYGVPWQWTDSQNVPSRVNDEQVGQLLKRTKKNADQFRHSLDRALRSRMDGSREDDNINQFVADFAETTDHLSDHFDRRQVVTNDIEDVLRSGVSIDSFMQRHQLAVQAENDWLTVRRDLDELARAYNVAWDWSHPRYTTDEPIPGLYRRLTGTYQLESGLGDDPHRAAEQAARTLPSDQRQRAYQRLITRLEAPETIAIDRNENSVTMASSLGQRVTFEADGQVRTEHGDAGRTVKTRATLHGDQLVVTTTGNRDNDFSVTFEPIDNGRNLRVTRRIYDDNLRQPVTVQSFYRRSSDEAQWDVYSINRGTSARSDSAAGNVGVPPGTRLVATLDNALSTRDAHAEDRFSITTRSPSPYEGAVIEGTVSSVNASGRLSGRAEMALNFESIRMRNGRTYPFAGVIESVHTANGETISVDNGTFEDTSQTGTTVQRGAIGAALGAIIGAISGGGKGAAIGAVIGAGAGAGSVIVQGRDQLDLPRGTELTITSSLSQRQSTSSSRQR